MVRALPLLWLLGCGDVAGLRPQPVDAGAQFPPQSTPRIQEDFNHRDLIGSETGDVILDINRGLATLPAETFPDFNGEGESSYAQMVQQNGLIEAEVILIRRQGGVDASDSVELRADDSVVVEGDLIVGEGGITIIAKKQIRIDGTITSAGPVRMLLADDDGTIEINGRVHTRSTRAGPAHVSIAGRGQVTITGTIDTTADSNQTGGDIRIETYGDIRLLGEAMHIFATADDLEGTAGTIDLRSEANIEMEMGLIGIAPYADDVSVPGGSINLQAQNIEIGEEARISAFGSALGKGGSVNLIAARTISTSLGTLVRAGKGADGGNINFRAKSIELGAQTHVEAGAGSNATGSVTMQAATSMQIDALTVIIGGTGGCAAGGDVLIEVAGDLLVSERVTIAGGPVEVDSMCGRSYPGGSVTVVAIDPIGVLEAVVPGTGAVPGATSVETVSDLTVPTPRLETGAAGEIQSRTIDRGEIVDAIPRLAELAAVVPAGTDVQILLASDDEPDGRFEEWLPVSGNVNDQRLQSFLGKRYVRYRVVLEGRRFDAPILDYFEIDLAPAGF